MLKRLLDISGSIALLVLLCIPLLILAAWIRIDSPGPALFRQVRVGRHGREFRILKLRTMRIHGSGNDSQLTVGEDNRITIAGRFLRRYKLDELPQLMNVLKGEMSLVGPRPEVPRYVAHYPADVRDTVLSVKPGITDPASIEFRNESELLGRATDPEKVYLEKILPIKLGYYVQYVQTRSMLVDVRILLKTLVVVFAGR